MIAYFDTSAIVPLVIAESGTDAAGRIWDGGDRVVSIRLAASRRRLRWPEHIVWGGSPHTN